MLAWHLYYYEFSPLTNVPDGPIVTFLGMLTRFYRYSVQFHDEEDVCKFVLLEKLFAK